MAATVDKNSWAEALNYLTTYIVDELVDTKQAVTFNSNYDKGKTVDIVNAAFQKVVIPFAQRREDVINNKLHKSELDYQDLERKINSATAEKDSLEQLIKLEKEEFVSTEESYARQLKDLTTNHQAALVQCDEDISTRDTRIEELNEQIKDLKKELRNKKSDTSNEDYIKDLEESHQELESEKAKLEEQVARLRANISDKESYIGQERQDVNKFIGQIRDKDRELDESRRVIRYLETRISELESAKDNAEKAAQTLTATVEERQRAIDQLKKDIEEYTKRSVSSRGKSSKSGSSIGPTGTLDTELQLSQKDETIEELTDENNALHAQVDQLEKELTETRDKIEILEKDLESARDAKNNADQRVRVLESEAKEKEDQSTGDLEKLKRERDELEVSLRRAQSQNTDDTKEINRLKAIADNEQALQKRERELAAQLKARAKKIESMEAELKRLKEGAASGNNANGADAAKCEREKADLQRQLDKARTELGSLRKDYDILLARVPTDNDEIKRLRDQLTKANRELEEVSAENARARERLENRINELVEQNEQTEARLNTLTDEYNALLARSQGAGEDITEYYENLFESLQQHTREVQQDLDEQVRANKIARDQYLERLGQMNNDINRNPRSAEASATKRRIVGLQKEIERMSSLIKTLQAENAFFQDTAARFQAAREKTAEAASQVIADAEAARLRLTEVLTARGGGRGAPAQTANRTVWGVMTDNRFVLGSNAFAFLLMIAMSIASGREFGLLKWANQPVRRSYFISALEAIAISLRSPLLLLIELSTIIFTGGLTKWYMV